MTEEKRRMFEKIADILSAIDYIDPEDLENDSEDGSEDQTEN